MNNTIVVKADSEASLKSYSFSNNTKDIVTYIKKIYLIGAKINTDSSLDKLKIYTDNNNMIKFYDQ